MSEEIFQKPKVFRPAELPVIDRGNGARTVQMVSSQVGSQRFLNGMTIFEPGAAIAHHTHNVPESVMVVSGEAVVNIDGNEFQLSTFDTTYVPANIPHHFRNASQSSEMRIFWTYGSINATRTIESTGITVRIDDELKQANKLLPVVEEALIEIKPGTNQSFEAAVKKAIPIFQAASGSRSFELDRVLEEPNHYLLRVGWDSVESHTELFRGSEGFVIWRQLVGEFFATPPSVRHLRNVVTGF